MYSLAVSELGQLGRWCQDALDMAARDRERQTDWSPDGAGARRGKGSLLPVCAGLGRGLQGASSWPRARSGIRRSGAFVGSRLRACHPASVWRCRSTCAAAGPRL